MNAAPPVVRAARRAVLADSAILALVAAAWAVALAADLSGRRSWVHHHELAGNPTAGELLVFLVAWAAMAGAMMLPTALPLIRLFARSAAGQDHPGPVRLVFVAAYLLVWLAFGVAALFMDMGVHRAVDASAWLRERPWLLPGTSLLAAGLFQFSDLKKKCLTECRHPAAYLLRHYRRGVGASFRMGLGHGLFCLGCCWALMLLMFAMGIANLAWMAALTAMMVVEKNVPGGGRIVRPGGVGLIAVAILVLAQPTWLPSALHYTLDSRPLASPHTHS